MQPECSLFAEIYGGHVEDDETSGFDEVDIEDNAEEDEDDLLDLIPPEDDRDPDELANIVRPDLVAKTFKALSADAQRAGGTLSRDDANRAYLRRELSIAERIEVEGKLVQAGYRIAEEDEHDEEKDGSVTTSRRKFRYLSHNEERELGRRIQLALKLPPDTTGLPADYIERIRRDADKARATFVAGNVRYVHKLARRHGQKRHLTVEDLSQEGMIGLLRATDLYDPELGFRFKTYATWWIEQRMHRAIADDDRLVRLPVHLHDTLKRVKRAEVKLTLALGTAPTTDQLAKSIGMDPERLQKLLWRVQATEVIEGDSPIGEDTTILALAPDHAESAFDVASHKELHERFRDVLSELTPREERIVRMRFGIGLAEAHTLESIGGEYKVTRERIRQIEAKALGKLRHPARSKKLRGFLES